MKILFDACARLVLRLSVVTVLLVPWAARGQCLPDWLPGGGVPGVSGLVGCATTWDPDGPGPRGPMVVVGGGFGIAGNVVSRHVAGWDGSAWHPMSLGLGSEVRALTVYNGEPVAGIYGSSVSGVARWHDGQWIPMGVLNGNIEALTVYNGDLIAGGDFSAVSNGIPFRGLARWDGAAWRWMNIQITAGGALAFAQYRGRLIVGGGFTTVEGWRDLLAWDGSGWSPLNDQDLIYVLAMTVYNDQLVVAGEFGRMWDARGWDGTRWRTLGDGFDDRVDTLAVHDGRLYAGGMFIRSAGGEVLNGLARLDGAVWQSLDAEPSAAEVHALVEYNGALVVGGGFSIRGGVGMDNVAAWGGSGWSMMGDGFSAPAFAIAPYNGEVVVGGIFAAAGAGAAHRIAAWNGASWRELGGGVSASTGEASVGSFALYHGQLIAGGIFESAGGAGANNIAAWDGAGWHALGEGLTGTGAAVRALAVYGDDLIAAGRFTSAGGAAASNIAAWNGAAWRPLGDGLTAGTLSYDNTPVVALAVYNGALIAGGAFTHAGGAPIVGIARWDGSSWGTLGGVSSLGGVVRALGLFNGGLIVGGTFIAPMGGQTAFNIALYDGTWRALPGISGNVRAVAAYSGALYAGGDWTGGLSVLDGSVWAPLGLGVGEGPADHGSFGQVNACVEYNGDLWVAGWFLTAGGRVSASIARWGCPCYANCDRSTVAPVLNVNDFVCFLNRFAAGDPYANCDHSTAPPVLSALDFACFASAFVGGCP